MGTDEQLTDAMALSRSVSDPQAFVLIFDRYYVAVHRYLSRRVGAVVADDLAAETFTRAFARRSAYDASAPRALPWLLGIAVNLLFHHRRTEVRRGRALVEADARDVDVADRFTDVSNGRLDAESWRASLVAALKQLEERDREALLLLAWGDLTYDEIATVLGVPVGTVRSRLNRARRLLRAGLDGRDSNQVLRLAKEGVRDG